MVWAAPRRFAVRLHTMFISSLDVAAISRSVSLTPASMSVFVLAPLPLMYLTSMLSIVLFLVPASLSMIVTSFVPSLDRSSARL